jgi:serralysin
VYGYAVVDQVGKLGHDTLLNVERIQFADNKWTALDIDGAAGQVYRLYQAAFDRVPDAGGFAYWLKAVDNGLTYYGMAEAFTRTDEFKALFTADPSDTYFLTQMYAHVLHRQPDAAGLEWWIEGIRTSSRHEVLAGFSESPENQAQVIGSIQNGIEYTPWL